MKQKIQLAALLSLIACATFVISCKKDKENNPAKTKMELLTTGSWKRTGLISHPAYDWYGNGVSDTDVLKTMKSCELDNFDTYKTNGIWELNEGPAKCDASDPQTWTLPWTFADNETKLIFDGTDEYTLLELTATTLKFQSTFVENGITYTQVETYGH
jgi:hypothetical protein